MIHSMSGGILAENGIYTFAKVSVDDMPYWYLSPFDVREGDRVLVPFGKNDTLRYGTVQRTETCSSQCAPVPMNRIKAIASVLGRTPF